MDCKCGGIVTDSEYKRKSPPFVVYTRKCNACNREEKSADFHVWMAPAKFWSIHAVESGMGGLTPDADKRRL